VPIAIEIFDRSDEPGAIRIDINGTVWARVRAADLPEKLAEIGRAYVDGEIATLLRRPSRDT
jgi:hypothetical protein